MTPTTPRPRRSAVPAAWALVIFAGAITITFNIWNATHGGRMELSLAVATGIAPVVVAALLSEIVAAYHGGWVMKAIAFTVMIAGMVLSMRAIGVVVHPAEHQLALLFGATIDAAALVALHVIMNPAPAQVAAQVAAPVSGPSVAPVTAQVSGPSTAQVAAPVVAHAPAPIPAARTARPAQRNRLNKSPEAEQARADYRKSLRAGPPLTDRALGEKYGRSRQWGKSRIRECQDGPQLAKAQ